MSDLLSQAEIDALLNGFDGDEGSQPVESAQQMQQSVDEGPNEITQSASSLASSNSKELSLEEKDVLGEVGNISMGASATTLSTLISQEVTITTPKVEIMSWEEIVNQYPKPYVVAKVQYTEGLIGTNLLIMKVEDIRILTNLMMGEEVQMQGEQLSELQLSAISEAMNQMIGSSCTSMSSLIRKKIDITPPTADYVDFSTDDRATYEKIYENTDIVKISFRMVVGTLIDSEIMQLLPLQFAKEMVSSMLSVQNVPPTQDSQPVRVEQPIETVQPSISPQQTFQQSPPQSFNQPMSMQPSNSQQQQFMNQAMNFAQEETRQSINVQPVQFQSLEDGHYMNYKENIGLIMDVPLQVTVELGRATRMIREILEFGPGSIIELDKLAGEPVDILVNGKIIAKGEVVVIDESFGIRVTDIIHPSKRI